MHMMVASDSLGKLIRIDPVRAAGNLAADAERYRSLVLSRDAADAEIIDPAIIQIDIRVLLKCTVPKCSGFGTSANCPPHCMSPDETQRVLKAFSSALVFRMPVAPDVVVRDPEKRKDLQAIRRRLYKLIAEVEGAAFHDGHYFATGFASGSCKSALCTDRDCAVLAGQKCRHDQKARPAMEAVGIDCFLLAARLGWDIYPIGGATKAEQIPAAHLMSLILIG